MMGLVMEEFIKSRENFVLKICSTNWKRNTTKKFSKVKKKDTRTNIFQPCSSVSIVTFEQVNVGLVYITTYGYSFMVTRAS